MLEVLPLTLILLARWMAAELRMARLPTTFRSLVRESGFPKGLLKVKFDGAGEAGRVGAGDDELRGSVQTGDRAGARGVNRAIVEGGVGGELDESAGTLVDVEAGEDTGEVLSSGTDERDGGVGVVGVVVEVIAADLDLPAGPVDGYRAEDGEAVDDVEILGQESGLPKGLLKVRFDVDLRIRRSRR
ncbi:MAG: hypothetical protein U0794_22255 [Isosphaeraceae bacterium]